ncbi:MAG: hypothetical protein KDJ47_08545 [Hyphomicrobiaceae bacterium]|nr:hypothetical protein [Caldilineaceae bacterium]MCB1505012.1 hypothetical protein [Hyphomicrobiaceae bacterium]
MSRSSRTELDAVALAQAERALAIYTRTQHEREVARQAAEAEQIRLKMEAEATEQARQAAELARMEAESAARIRAREAEDYAANPANLDNVLLRFQSSAPEHQALIASQIAGVLRQHRDNEGKIPFADLPLHGRLVFLGAFLDIRIGKDYPRLDLATVDLKANAFVYVSRYGPADLTIWRAKREQIDRYLGGRWQVDIVDGTSVKLRRLPDLPARIPFDRQYLREGHVFMGIRVDDATPLYWPLRDMTHSLVAGMTGVGKSFLLRQLLCSVFHNLSIIDELILVDLKGGVELMRFTGWSPKITVIKRYEDLHAVIDGLVATMNRRFDEMEAVVEVTYPGRYIFLVIDEYSAISLTIPPKGDKDKVAQHAQLLANLSLLAAQARAANIRIYAQLQKPIDKHIETSVRENLPSTLCFMMQSRTNAAALFGDLDSLPADPIRLPRGQYLFKNGATNAVDLIQATYVDPDDLDLMRACIPFAERTSP